MSDRLRDLDLNLLWALDALLERRSVTGAATKLGLTPPATSHALSRLRELLGDPLLVRAGRAMVLTTAATSLEPRVREALERARQVLTPLQAADVRELDRVLVVHASDYALLVLGAAVDARAREHAPKLRLQFLPNDERDPELLRTGALHLALGVYNSLPPEIRTQTLFEERLVWVIRKDHPFARRRIGKEQFAELEHIQVSPRGRPGGVVDDALARAGLRRRVTRAVPYFLSALHLVADTDCALAVPERVARATARRFGLRVLELPVDVPPYPFKQVWHPRNHDDPAHRWLRDACMAAARSRRPS